MLFNSPVFLGVFLPLTLLGFFLLAGSGRQRFAAVWLTLASLVFYGWWNPAYVPLLVASMLFNFVLGGYLRRRPSHLLLLLGVTANLALLGYYKYTGFLFGTLDEALGLGWSIGDIILPLAISFYTFQQIAYLSDANDGAVVEHDFVNYCLFITFFPQLIAGPITHHGEMFEQFGDRQRFRPHLANLALGVTVFLTGLFKKVVIADPLGQTASPLFAATAAGGDPVLQEAWLAALSYTLQIYFDFSGYSDMAIGLGLMFSIRLPANFDSPFKARNVIEYWTRWHMTLTRFLTAYIYNPIVLRVTRRRVAAGKPLPRRGKLSVSTFIALVAYPTLLTMFLSGVWHGAGWQFVVFGLLHGVYLVVAHGWRAFKTSRGIPLDSESPVKRGVAVATTFLCVVVAMVFFRAPDVSTAMAMLAGMAGLHGLAADSALQQLIDAPTLAAVLRLGYRTLHSEASLIAALLAFVWLLPNTLQWMQHYGAVLNWRPRAYRLAGWLPYARWVPAPAIGIAIGVLGFFALATAFSAAPTEFLYFQF